MAVRSLLLAAVVGVAAASAFLPAAAQSRSSVSISIGAPAPYYGYDNGYGNRYGGQRHRPGYAWVPAHWVSTHHGRVWMPGQYVRVQGHGYDPRRGHGGYNGYGGYGGYNGYDGYGGNHGYNRYDGYGRPGVQVIYRSGSRGVVPRSYYPPGYLSPYDNRRGW